VVAAVARMVVVVVVVSAAAVGAARRWAAARATRRRREGGSDSGGSQLSEAEDASSFFRSLSTRPCSSGLTMRRADLRQPELLLLDAFLSLHVRVEVALHAAPTAAWCWPRCTRHTLRAARSLEMD
jgi:hypothetical protein